ncbi:MAG: efflux RND transporter periplasmic adaptor subunit [Candidatus Cloacimonetes bacterium]|nr:efflux RND transporter periplasmic adaptor subunit [Candidatus Cloacimonadota bacterium]
MKIKFAIVFILLVLLTMSACGKGDPKEKKNGNQNQEKAVPVMVETVTERNLSEYMNVTGVLEGITDVTITSEVNGKITDIFKTLGDWVSIGDSIARIDNADYLIIYRQAGAARLSAEAGLESARLAWNSSQTLYKSKSISEAEHVQARSLYKSAEAGYEGARAGLEAARKALDNSRFIAPVSGYIAYMPLETGTVVNMGTPVCTLVNTRKLIIKTGVGESYIPKIKRNQEVYITHESLSEPIIGKITGIGIKPAMGTASYPIEIILSNPGGTLYPGMVVHGEILAKEYKNIIYASMNNLIQQYDKYYAYILQNDNTVTRCNLRLGKKIGEKVIVLSGLTVGDIIVTEGLSNLEEGSKIDIRQSAVSGE